MDPFIKITDFPFKEILDFYAGKYKKNQTAAYIVDCIIGNKMLSAKYINIRPSVYYQQNVDTK